jgi:hypothetical protein
LLKFLLPYSQIDTSNPIFQRDLRRLRWLRSPQSLRRYTLIVTLGIPLLILGWWILERAAYGFGEIPVAISVRLIYFCIIGVAVLAVSSNFFAVVSTIAFMHRSFDSDEWALLRIAVQDEQTILALKDAIAQIYAWRVAVFEVGIRLALTLIAIPDKLYIDWLIGDDSLFLSVLCPVSWLFYALTILTGFILSIEPLLRVRVN